MAVTSDAAYSIDSKLMERILSFPNISICRKIKQIILIISMWRKVTDTIEHWRSGTSQNYGIMLVGTDESERKDYNSFYSEYELLGIDGEKAYDW